MFFRYYIIYVFRGAGLTGTRGNLIADSVQYVLNVVFTIPAIMYIDKWGRRPMLIFGTLFMGFWLSLVGGLQGRYGDWGIVDGSRVWVINGHQAADSYPSVVRVWGFHMRMCAMRYPDR